ncbi:MAG: glutamate-5-semialdehyde dehydrogenase [Clostridiales bacterium]|nr:glutamate-5-semialdehyde dehydrogenase [Clostridiales bacterium]
MTKIEMLGLAAKTASRRLSLASPETKNKALTEIADALERESDRILCENKKDLDAAKENGMSSAMLDRLTLTEARIKSFAEGVRQVARLPDPVDRLIERIERPNGLIIEKIAVPLGVIGIIYESRPNVTADAAAICLKSGNAVILRGGSEAIHSNYAIVNIMRAALENSGLPADCVCFVEDTSRESARELMSLTQYLDVLIPRGGAGLIEAVVQNSKVPVIKTGVGICHVYVDESADIQMAARITSNAKCSRPSVCNAAECLLVSEAIAERFLPAVKKLLDEYNVELRCCERSAQIIGADAIPAVDEDYDTEFLDYILAVRVVSGLDEAIEFINQHGSGHSEAIVTASDKAAERFLKEVDAAAVYVNASTRFTDGGEFGLGAEIGISTQKLHARGPMGIRELTSTKFMVRGSGQTR